MARIAVITGASSGIGRKFAETIDKYGKFDEVWVIARNKSKLDELVLPFQKNQYLWIFQTLQAIRRMRRFFAKQNLI